MGCCLKFVAIASAFLLTLISSGAVYWQYYREEATSLVQAKLDYHDVIYNTKGDTSNYIPVVNEEYKTVFFFGGMRESTAWKRMFVRMTGSPKWYVNDIHQKEVNSLKWLNDFSLEDAQQIMTSPEWTRAIFVQNPKHRLLSVFKDQAKHTHIKGHFVNKISKLYGNLGEAPRGCNQLHQVFTFFLKNITAALPTDSRWMQIYDQIDEKWWPYINYVGDMDHLSEDAEALLRSITSDKDGASAWESWGRTGWGELQDGTTSFLAQDNYNHHTDNELHKFYNARLENFVEKKYPKDLNNTYFQVSPVEIYPHSDFAKFEVDTR